jgi:hypothetical protein
VGDSATEWCTEQGGRIETMSQAQNLCSNLEKSTSSHSCSPKSVSVFPSASLHTTGDTLTQDCFAPVTALAWQHIYYRWNRTEKLVMAPAKGCRANSQLKQILLESKWRLYSVRSNCPTGVACFEAQFQLIKLFHWNFIFP